jgi:hypothetical protein
MASQVPLRAIPPAFEVDGRVVLRIEPNLATALGRLILETDTTNNALLALGHQLRSLPHVMPARPPVQDQAIES